MFVRNNTTCPSCGTTGAAYLSIEKARIVSKVVPISAECGNCSFRNTVIMPFEEVYDTVLKGYFLSLSSEFDVNEVMGMMKRYRFRYKVTLLNKLRDRLRLGATFINGPLCSNIFFDSLAEEVWACFKDVPPTFASRGPRIRALGL